MTERPLTEDEQWELLAIPEETSSDYDDGREGWPNYWVERTDGGPVLVIRWEPERDGVPACTQLARWKLTYLGGTETPPDRR